MIQGVGNKSRHYNNNNNNTTTMSMNPNLTENLPQKIV
jgi:hypothetical protein